MQQDKRLQVFYAVVGGFSLISALLSIYVSAKKIKQIKESGEPIPRWLEILLF